MVRVFVSQTRIRLNSLLLLYSAPNLEISITSEMQMTPPLSQEVKRTKEPLDEGERGEQKG